MAIGDLKMVNLISAKQVEEYIRLSAVQLMVKNSPINRGKLAVEVTVRTDDNEYVGFITKSNEPTVREYAEEQTAINTVRKMAKRAGVSTLDCQVRVSA